MLKNLYVMHFSPTGGTKAGALSLGKSLGENIEEIDLSKPPKAKYTFTKDDTVLFALPVFAGRIPPFTAEKLKEYQGNGATAIIMAVYGNRAYDDALLELKDSAEAQGFTVKAATAVIAEHSMVHTVAQGRPNEKDQQEMAEFAAKILVKLSKDPNAKVEVPGNSPYKPWQPLPVTPLVSADCDECGRCAKNCPTQAIDKENLKATNPDKCILCMRCVVQCHTKARALPPQIQAMMEEKLGPLANVTQKNELFL
ncbi:MAG: 4Fe-4S binding protein [Clostridiales bacterium]